MTVKDDFLDYEITDVEAYSTMLRGANVELIQLEPGPLRGHHLRTGLPGGEISWIVTNLPLRGRGHFPAGIWTLSVVTGAASRALQHGVEVSVGTQFCMGRERSKMAPTDGIFPWCACACATRSSWNP